MQPTPNDSLSLIEALAHEAIAKNNMGCPNTANAMRGVLDFHFQNVRRAMPVPQAPAAPEVAQ